MGSFRCDGLEETIRRMESLESGSEEMIDTYLTEAGERMRQLVLEEAAKSRYRMDSLRNHVKVSKPKEDKDGNWYVTVSVPGKNERGERYGTVYFVLNYGRRSNGAIEPSYFWTRAVKRANEEAPAIAQRVMEEHMKGSD